jgi:hypothetical protein
MARRLLIVCPAAELRAEVTDENPRTTEAICSSLPMGGAARRWGKEVYFYVELRVPLENGRQALEVGEIGYWPEGPAIAIFFGPTPSSIGKEPRAYSDVNVFARLVDDPAVLDEVREGDRVEIRALSP